MPRRTIREKSCGRRVVGMTVGDGGGERYAPPHFETGAVAGGQGRASTEPVTLAPWVRPRVGTVADPRARAARRANVSKPSRGGMLKARASSAHDARDPATFGHPAARA